MVYAYQIIKIALDLLSTLGEPILSCSLMLPNEEHTTQSDPEEIRDRLEHQVDLIIHGGYLGQEPHNSGRFNGRIASDFTRRKWKYCSFYLTYRRL